MEERLTLQQQRYRVQASTSQPHCLVAFDPSCAKVSRNEVEAHVSSNCDAGCLRQGRMVRSQFHEGSEPQVWRGENWDH